MVTYGARKGLPTGWEGWPRETGDTATLIREILHILRLVVRSGDGTSGNALPPSFAYTSRTANNLTHTYDRIPTYRIKSLPPLGSQPCNARVTRGPTYLSFARLGKRTPKTARVVGKIGTSWVRRTAQNNIAKSASQCYVVILLLFQLTRKLYERT